MRKQEHSSHYQSHPSEPYPSRKQVAKILGISVMTVKRAEGSGKLTPIRLGTRIVRYHPDEVARWIAQSR